MPSAASFAKYGFGGGLGLLLMGYATQTYLWYGYQKVNPAVGYPDTSPWFAVSTASLFLLGTVLTYVAFARGIVHGLTATE